VFNFPQGGEKLIMFKKSRKCQSKMKKKAPLLR